MCAQLDGQTGKCEYQTPYQPGQQAFLLIPAGGAPPASVSVTAHFDDGSSSTVTAGGCGTIRVEPAQLAPGTVGVEYTRQLIASGGAEPYTFAHEGVLRRTSRCATPAS